MNTAGAYLHICVCVVQMLLLVLLLHPSSRGANGVEETIDFAMPPGTANFEFEDGPGYIPPALDFTNMCNDYHDWSPSGGNETRWDVHTMFPDKPLSWFTPRNSTDVGATARSAGAPVHARPVPAMIDCCSCIRTTTKLLPSTQIACSVHVCNHRCARCRKCMWLSLRLIPACATA